MKTVLILGDSISLGYREMVKDLLKEEAEVVFEEENGRYAKYTMHMANQWIRNHGVPDIVHWNNGLWDITVEPPLDGSFTPLPEYLAALERMVRMFRTAGVKTVIFATTTYSRLEQSPEETVELYNAAAAALMKREGVPVNDLGGFERPRRDSFLCEDNLHMTDSAYRQLAEKVAEAIRPYL